MKENAYLVTYKTTMIVPATRTTPKPKELIRVLKQDFSDQYSYKLFGLGPQPTVIVSKSWFTGAQITIQKDEIRVERFHRTCGNFYFSFHFRDPPV